MHFQTFFKLNIEIARNYVLFQPPPPPLIILMFFLINVANMHIHSHVIIIVKASAKSLHMEKIIWTSYEYVIRWILWLFYRTIIVYSIESFMENHHDVH